MCGAVKSLAYSPDGLNIISAFIQSEISIWSSEEGFKVVYNINVMHCIKYEIFISYKNDNAMYLPTNY